VFAWIIPYLSILWCRIGHPALLHKLNTVHEADGVVLAGDVDKNDPLFDI